MNPDLAWLRRFAPLAVLIAIVTLGWLLLVRPTSAEHSRANHQMASLRQREMFLRRTVGEGSPHMATSDPITAFEQRVASGDSSPALLEQLARLASTVRVKNLLIETVEGGSATAVANAPRSSQPDPRFALFDAPVSYAPIRVAFETDYAGLGRFLWAFRDLPTTIEIRTLSIGAPQADAQHDTVSRPTGVLRVSMSLYAYSRSAPAVIQASNMAVAR